MEMASTVQSSKFRWPKAPTQNEGDAPLPTIEQTSEVCDVCTHGKLRKLSFQNKNKNKIELNNLQHTVRTNICGPTELAYYGRNLYLFFTHGWL